MKLIKSNTNFKIFVDIVLTHANIYIDPFSKHHVVIYKTATLPHTRCYICDNFKLCKFVTNAKIYRMDIINKENSIEGFGCSYFKICRIY
jgi:hypothetical protein